MKTDFLMGTGVALVTPFTQTLEIDKKALQRLVFRMIEGGVEYLVPLGTTGEAPTLDDTEKAQVLDIVFEAAEGKIPIVIGIGGNDTRQVEKKIKEWQKIYPLSGILSVCPYYNKPTPNGVKAHYSTLAQAAEVPIIMYNIPGRTGIQMSAETICQLATQYPNLTAVKEASGSVSQVMQIMQQKPSDFKVISGDDALTLPFMSVGAQGVISVIGNIFPREVAQKVHFALQDSFDQAQTYHYRLLKLMDYLFVEGNPSGVKAALEIMGITLSEVRLPLVKVSENYKTNLLQYLKEVNDAFGLG